MFHAISGKNVVVGQNGKVASWQPLYTGGCLFTEQPLSSHKSLTLVLRGTGGVELGFLDHDPACYTDTSLVAASSLQGYTFLNDVKIHRRTCKMTIQMNEKKQCVVSSYGEGQYSQQIEPNKQYWLSMDVKYGDVELKLENDESDNIPQHFSPVHGNNIQLLNDPSVSKTYQKSPAALCFYREPVRPGLRLLLHCTPKPHQGMIPGRFYMLLMYTTVNPEQLQQTNPDLFDVAYKKSPVSNMKKIEKFVKEECSGRPIVLDFYENKMVYTAASGKKNSQDNLMSGQEEVWLAIELYGVDLHLVKDTVPSAQAEQTGINTTDAKPVQPRSITTQDSESHLQVSEKSPLDILPSEEVGPNNVFPTSNLSDQAESVPMRCNSNTVTVSQEDQEETCNLAESIRYNFTYLLENFETKEFIDYMYEKSLITIKKLEEKPNTKDVLILLSKRPINRKFMKYALEKTGQSYLESKFFEYFEKE